MIAERLGKDGLVTFVWDSQFKFKKQSKSKVSKECARGTHDFLLGTLTVSHFFMSLPLSGRDI